ncbi:NAD(P)-dependent oxidoreductase [Actinosynnema sp. NPDC020468]|uniref:NAD-dependent epimerase/dehydratase family protein n=1 Tax=Actinosynnema sp. NPDC020468 TaxID=3154488 RepID=UPI0033C5D991
MVERILITGAAGSIGTMLRSRLARPGRVLRLLDVVSVEPGAAEEAVTASVTDPVALEEACAGVTAVVHLGGFSSEASWDGVLEVNIGGTHTVLESARRAGVRRVVLASSNHAVGYFAKSDSSSGEAPDYLFPAPDTYYGVSKVAMEALGSLYARRYGMDVIATRIGSCFAAPRDERMLATWLSPDDAGRLFEACLTAPAPGFRVVWGVSANRRRWFSGAEGEALGFVPQDDAEDHAASVTPSSEVALDHVGGAWVGPEWDTAVKDAGR